MGMFFSVFAAAICSLHLFSLVKGRSRIRHITKPFIIPSLFAAFGAYSTPILIAVAFFYCVGDIFMMYAENNRFLILGALSFAFGHLMYGAYFLSMHFSVAVLAITSLCYVFFVIIMVRRGNAGVLEVIYLSLLGILAVSVCASFRPDQILKSLSALTGVILFVSSDSMIVLGHTGVRSESDTAVMATYIAANIFLLMGT